MRNFRELQSTTRTEESPVGKVVNILFAELKAAFPAFHKSWPTPADYNRAKLTWVKAFCSAGISNIHQIQNGIKKCRLSESPFIPSVGQFIRWCTPTAEEVGFPDAMTAFSISAKINNPYEHYSHPHEPTDTVIRHAIQNIGPFQFRRMKEEEALKLFEYNYKLSIDQFLSGSLKTIQKAISEIPVEHPDDEPDCEDARAKCMAIVEKMLKSSINKKRR